TAWRELAAARERLAEAERDAGRSEDRLAELRALVEDAGGFEPGEEDELRAERERVRHVAELGEGASTAAAALSPDDGERVAEARAELDAREGGLDPLDAARRAADAAEERYTRAADALHKRRAKAAGAFADAVSERLASLGLGTGEFTAELGDAEPGATG